MKKIYIIMPLIIISFILSGIYFSRQVSQTETKTSFKVPENGVDTSAICPAPLTKTRVSACPSFYQDLDSLNQEIFTISESTSTADGLQKMDNNEIDVLVSGRIALPHENNYEYQVIADDNQYYSFLSKEAMQINHSDLKLYDIYTDIEDIEQIKIDLDINQDLIFVRDIYEHLDQAIVISRWSNTDFEKASMVQVFNEDGSRLAKSRIPTIYYKSNCTESIIEEIKNTLNK